jgi:pSer/pThr/pTyr-binding forkhead associated (FHA) protein
LLEGNHVIGRAPVRELQAYPLMIEEDQSISRNHIYLEQQPDGSFLVMDRHSTYGTRLNNQRLLPNKEYPFKPGDVLRLGNTSFQLAPLHAPVQPVTFTPLPQYRLRVEAGPDQGVRRMITTKPMVIGRAENSDWQLHDPGLARYHAEVCQTDEGVTIRALGRTPALYVNNHICTTHTLNQGDIVRLGETQVVFELED